MKYFLIVLLVAFLISGCTVKSKEFYLKDDECPEEAAPEAKEAAGTDHGSARIISLSGCAYMG